MTDRDTDPRPHGGVTESEMDQQRLGDGLGDTIDGRNIAEMGRPRDEPSRAADERPGARPAGNGAEDAGDIEDLGPEEGGPDGIESQDATGSGSSGL